MAALEFQSSFKNINQKEWNDLTKSNPFLRLEFFQSLEASKSIGEGCGLGLAIVDKITEAHNGKLVISNRAKKGLEVKIILPLISEA